MRVVQVSAHYPPNFVSGGTLVPQRIARALAGAGIESLVYAGHLDPARRPLETWTENDGDVAVRWVVTTPWTGWADPRNSENPAVETDFRVWLDEVRPDVVHLHSLQTLGGSLVRAAKDSGARVVVTMHDFWWICARQFLATKELRPCSLVVSCGICPCEVDHDWLVARNKDLGQHLAWADVVLAPSGSAARVLAANGVPAGRLRVDENGLPADARAIEYPTSGPAVPHAPQPGSALRLMFAGGDDPMKGVGLLLDATGKLADLDGWSLDMYGVTARQGAPSRVRFCGAYAPAELGAVLAAHDILVLPSIMRESHSILTREALAAGLVVVCSDTLGPEEAVRHGSNGLVFPDGDVDALSTALRALITDPDGARSMMGRGSASPIRSFDDQFEGLLDLYHELAAEAAGTLEGQPPGAQGAVAQSGGGTYGADRPAQSEQSPVKRVLFVVGIQGAPLRYRAQLPAEALRMLGITAQVRHYRDPALPRLVEDADAVVLYRVPATNQILDLVATAHSRKDPVPVLFDVDDLIFDPGLESEVHGLTALDANERTLWWRGVARYRTTMEVADVFVGSTDQLCSHATAVSGLPAYRYDNGVGVLLAQASDAALARARTPGPLRIGYFSGTTTHDADWAAVEPAVLAVMAARPHVELWLGGHLRTTDALDAVADRVRRLPFVPWHELPGLLRDVDVCLAPLTDGSRFNEAKSAIKWLESALVETAVVASPTQPFREAIDHGRTGFLATDEAAWREGIGILLDDAALRRRIGTQARREALLRWSPHLQGPAYLAVLKAAIDHVRENGPRRPSTWEPVHDDEPYSAADAWVERYAVPIGDGLRIPAALRHHPWVRKLGAMRRIYRAAGGRAVAAKVAAALRR
ncbi:glycosyltransferase [Georgenia sp. EYE_87]|uniref:glycosyltransferase n=1 Tax=Georgenia sp. EYE_87 TaxID=2853448 RepID=UPI0020056111|nr:glycosyltransferase [Georgenia sp. EYE_87]MCK6211779.1 glycosyltransferase [Georgenia sp. EYE_87]